MEDFRSSDPANVMLREFRNQLCFQRAFQPIIPSFQPFDDVPTAAVVPNPGYLTDQAIDLESSLLHRFPRRLMRLPTDSAEWSEETWLAHASQPKPKPYRPVTSAAPGFRMRSMYEPNNKPKPRVEVTYNQRTPNAFLS